MKKRIGALILAFVMVLGMGTVAPAAAADTDSTYLTATAVDSDIYAGTKDIAVKAAQAMTAVTSVSFQVVYDKDNLTFAGKSEIYVPSTSNAKISAKTEDGVTTYTWTQTAGDLVQDDVLFTMHLDGIQDTTLNGNYTVQLTNVTITGTTTETGKIVTGTLPISNCKAPITITGLDSAKTVTYGDKVTLSVTATNNTGYELQKDSKLSYQWQYSTNKGSSWTNAGTKSSIDLDTTTLTVANSGILYRVTVTEKVVIPADQDKGTPETEQDYSQTSDTIAITVNPFELTSSNVKTDSSLTYTGSAQVPEYYVEIGGEKVTLTTDGTDATATYTSYVSSSTGAAIDADAIKGAGNYATKLEGTGNFKGTVTGLQWSIAKKTIDPSNTTVYLSSKTEGGYNTVDAAGLLEALGFVTDDVSEGITVAMTAKTGTAIAVVGGSTNTISYTAVGSETAEVAINMTAATLTANYKLVDKNGATVTNATFDIPVSCSELTITDLSSKITLSNKVTDGEVALEVGLSVDDLVSNTVTSTEVGDPVTSTYTLTTKDGAAVNSQAPETTPANLKITDVGEYKIKVEAKGSNAQGTVTLDVTVTKGTIAVDATTLSTYVDNSKATQTYSGSALSYKLDENKLAATSSAENDTVVYSYLTAHYAGECEATNVKQTNDGKYTAQVTFTLSDAQKDNWTLNYGTDKDTDEALTYAAMDWKITQKTWDGGKLATVDSETQTVRAEDSKDQVFAIAETDFTDSVLANAQLAGAKISAIANNNNTSYITVSPQKETSGEYKDKWVVTVKAGTPESTYKLTLTFLSDNYQTIRKDVLIKAVATKSADGFDFPSTVKQNGITKTYTGAGQDLTLAEQASATDPELDEKYITYSYEATNGGELDATTKLPKGVGTYTVTATYYDEANALYGIKTATLTIKKANLTITGYTVADRTYEKDNKSTATPLKITSFDVTGWTAADLAAGKKLTQDDVLVYFANTAGVYDSDAIGTRTISGITFGLKSDSTLAASYTIEGDMSSLTGTGKIIGTPLTKLVATATEESYAYTGEEIVPELTFTNNGTAIALVEGTDYTLDTTGAVNVGRGKVIVKSAEGSQYSFDDIVVNIVITGADLDASKADATLAYTAGSDVDASKIVVKVGEKTVTGSITTLSDAQVAQIKAMTAENNGKDANKINVTFTPDAASGFNQNAVSITVVVTVAATTTNPGEDDTKPTTPPTDETPVETPDSAELDTHTVAVVLKSYTIKATGKQIKPSVSVYTSAGKKLKVGTDYTVDFGNYSEVGPAQVVVTLNGETYSFADGSDEQTVPYTIVAKKNPVVLTASNKTVTYGTAVTADTVKATLKVSGKKVTTKFDIDLAGYEDGILPVGTYAVTVSTTYGGETYYAQVLVTVKAAKVSPKAAKIDGFTVSEGLDKQVLEEKIAKYVAANTKGLSADDFTITVDVSDIPTVNKAKTYKVAYTIALTTEAQQNMTISGKTSKIMKASVKVG